MFQIDRRQGLMLALSTAAPLWVSAAPSQSLNPRSDHGDWLAMVHQHHQDIARAFDVLLAADDQPFDKLRLQLRNLDQLITAHSLAEEKVLYPAMALADLQKQSEDLYMTEAHIKIELARTELAAAGRKQDRSWVSPARTLQSMVLRHAVEDEEKRLFPELHQRLGERNRATSSAYAAEFSRVIPLVGR